MTIAGGERTGDAEGDALLREAREGPLDPGFRSQGRPGLCVRLTCRPSRALPCVRAGAFALERFDDTVNVAVHPAIAAADLWILNRRDADPLTVFREVAAAVQRAGGGTARLRRPFESHGGVLEGVKSPNFAVMERLKRHFDPHNLLNPGILPFPVKDGEFAAPAQAASNAH
jgi:hypothetical protein